MIDVLRIVGPLVLAVVGAMLCDLETHRRGLTPPGFENPWRRGLALAALATALYVGVFAALGALGLETEVDTAALTTFDLFSLHILFLGALVVWYLLGFGTAPGFRGWLRQFGLRAERPGSELLLGLAAGIGGWMLVMAVMILVALVTLAVGGDETLPQAPPELVIWIAGLSIGVRASISLSAGVVEELFFRGFLQPRTGILASTLLFVLAHAAYESPFMLLGIGILSFLFAGLVVWRQNVIAAITAHAVFDAVQLLAVIPSALEFLQSHGVVDEGVVALLLRCGVC